MSELEKKAIVGSRIWNNDKSLKQKWVLLEDAKGFEQKASDFFWARQREYERANKAEAKIAEVNKILDDFFNGRIIYNQDLYRRLKACLTNENNRGGSPDLGRESALKTVNPDAGITPPSSPTVVNEELREKK